MGNCGSEYIIKNNLSLMTVVKSLSLYYSETKKQNCRDLVISTSLPVSMHSHESEKTNTKKREQ